MTTKSNLPIALDVMGGDCGLDPVVQGAVDAANTLNLKSILVGDEALIKQCLEKCFLLNNDLISIEHAPEFVAMHESPTKAIRSKSQISVRRAFELVREGTAAAAVSPGNTGAMLAAGTFVSGTIEGVTRPAIATLIPRGDDTHPTVLIDSGANVQCNAEQLLQFAIMGKYYSESLFNIKNPKIGILSNGTESSKGNDLSRAAAYILSRVDQINYVGFIEGRHIPQNIADVVVCDGFVGNIVLKTMEGSVGLVVESIKQHIGKSLRGKIGMWLAKPVFKQLFREKLDPSSYGGAPLLGLNSIGIVCHGSSNAKAIYNAARVAKQLFDSGILTNMQSALSNIEDSLDSSIYEDGMWQKIGGEFDVQGKKRVKKFNFGKKQKVDSPTETV